MKWSAVAADARSATGLSADDVAGSRQGGPALEPGKGTLVDQLSNRTQHGACTHLGPGAPGCYLDDDVRADYFVELGQAVGTAQTNFKLAVNSLRVKELLTKEDELDWLTGLIIEVASTFLGSAFGRALKKIRGLGAEALGKRIQSSTLSGSFTLRRADALLRGVSDARIDAWTKAAFDPLKKRGQGLAKVAQNDESRGRASDVEAFLKGLSTSADRAYNAFLKQMKSDATDSELAVALEGMQIEHHSQALYEDALSDKLERYKKSRVRDIGRKLAKDDNRITTVARETRVVWVVHHTMPGKTLHYQYQD